MPHKTRNRIPITPKILDRFRGRFVRKKKDECWLWEGAISDGYGMLLVGGDSYLAHRVSYQVYKGPIPKGKLILHTCHNRRCVNPNHLKAGTNQDNMNDMVTAGRARGGHPPGENHPCARLTDSEVAEIRRMRASGAPYKTILARFNVSLGHARDIVFERKRKWQAQ